MFILVFCCFDTIRFIIVFSRRMVWGWWMWRLSLLLSCFFTRMMVSPKMLRVTIKFLFQPYWANKRSQLSILVFNHWLITQGGNDYLNESEYIAPDTLVTHETTLQSCQRQAEREFPWSNRTNNTIINTAAICFIVVRIASNTNSCLDTFFILSSQSRFQ